MGIIFSLFKVEKMPMQKITPATSPPTFLSEKCNLYRSMARIPMVRIDMVDAVRGTGTLKL